MKRFMINIMLLVLVLLLAGLVGLGILLNTFDPNAYKQELAEAFHKASGRTILFDGELQTTIFPAIGLKTGRIRIADETIYGPDPFLVVDHTTLRLSLSALIKRKILVEEVVIDGLTLKLATSATGKNNWEFQKNTEEHIARREADGVTSLAPPEPQPSPEETADKKPFELAISKMTITNTTVNYLNLRTGESYKTIVDSVELKNLALGQQIELDLNGFMEDQSQSIGAEVALKALITISPQGEITFSIQSLNLDTGKRGNHETSSTGVSLHANAKVHYSPQGRILSVQDLTGTIDSVPFVGSLQLNLGALEGNNQNATQSLSGALEINGTLDIDKLQAAFTLPQKAKPVAPVSTETTPLGNPVQPRTSQSSRDGSSSGLLTSAEAEFSLKAQEVVIQGVSLVAPTASLQLKKGNLSLNDCSFGAFGGTITCTAIANLHKPSLQLQGNLTGNSLDAKAALSHVAKTVKLSGKADLSANLNTRGNTPEEMLRSLKGTAGFTLAKADLQLPKRLTEAAAIAKLPSTLHISQASGTFQVNNGVATTRNLGLSSSLLQAKGSGAIGFLDNTLDVTFTTSLSNTPLVVPVRLHGSLRSPSVEVVAQDMTTETVKEVLRDPKKVEKELRHLKKKIKGSGLDKLFR